MNQMRGDACKLSPCPVLRSTGRGDRGASPWSDSRRRAPSHVALIEKCYKVQHGATFRVAEKIAWAKTSGQTQNARNLFRGWRALKHG